MSETPDPTETSDENPPPFIEVQGLPGEADDNGKVADQSPVVDREATDTTVEVLPADDDEDSA